MKPSADSTVDALIAHLPSLSLSDLRKVRAVADRLADPSAKSKPAAPRIELPPDEADFVRWIYEAFAEELQRRQETKQAPYPAFEETKTFARIFLPAARKAYGAHKGWFPTQTKVQRLQTVRLYAELAINLVVSQRRQVHWFRLCAALANLPETIDAFFPGYIESGLLSTLAQTIYKGRTTIAMESAQS